MTKTERNVLIACAAALAVVVAWRLLRKPAQKSSGGEPESTYAASGIATFQAYTPLGVIDVPFAELKDDGSVVYIR